MSERLSRFGVGPKIVASVVASAAVAGALSYGIPDVFIVPAWNHAGVMTLAVVLIAIGLPMWVVGGVAAMKAYNSDRLVTTGVYAIVRHPMYSAWIVLILPGIALLTASWPFLLMPVVGYAVFKALIRAEDEYLLGRFGQSYANYRESVNEIIPIPRARHHSTAHR